MTTATYILSKSVATRYKKQLQTPKLFCDVCGKPIEPKQEVTVRRHSTYNGMTRTKICHKKCYETLFIDLED